MPEPQVFPSQRVTTKADRSLSVTVLPESMCGGILLVDPDISKLSAEYLLLSNSNYSVTPAFSHQEVFVLRETKAVALAILSDSLGRQLLGAIAKTVRRQWPLARILIRGHAESMLEDHLYDEQIGHSPNAAKLLDDLERLYKGSWNQLTNTLDWNTVRASMRAGRSPLCESDPSKSGLTGLFENKLSHDIPADFRFRSGKVLSTKQATMQSHSALSPTQE